MNIPRNAFIAEEKLTRYLLQPRLRNDKSGYLALVGFTLANWERLELAIRNLIDENDAVPDRLDQYGVFYQVEGELRGPNGILRVITVWLEEADDGQFRFVTLKPAR